MQKEIQHLDWLYHLCRKGIVTEEWIEFKQQEFDWYERQYKLWKRSQRRFDPWYLYEMFPEVAPKPPQVYRSRITDDMIENARSYPISMLINVSEAKGTRMKIRCPFDRDHMDKNPSATLNIDKNYVYCHVCSKGTDSIGLFRYQTNATFNEAVTVLSR